MNKLLTVLLISTVSCTLNAQESNAVKDDLTKTLDSLHELDFINGFSVAIVNQEGTLYSEGFGLADVEQSKKFTENTLLNIGSISKTFIGVALLKAQELGELELDDPIGQYLPFDVFNPYFPNKIITIRQLATHTSSLRDASVYEKRGYVLKEVEQNDTKAASNFNPPENIMAMGEFLEAIFNSDGKWYKKRNFLKERPGDRFEYSNLGAGLAAYVLEQATEKPFREFTTEHILRPLGMLSSGWRFEDINLSDHAKLYSDTQTELPYYSLINYADGGLISSASDMAIYLTELINGRDGNGTLLTKTSYNELFRPQLTADNFKRRSESAFNDEYNSGIFMGFSAKEYIGHTGSDPGIVTFMFFHPQTRVGKILMVNTDLRKEGIDEFIAIWKTLDDYEGRLK